MTKRLKKDRVKSLKTKLWRVFSQYIRLSHADHTGWVLTCDGEWHYWKDVHCGHLWANTERNKQLGGNELWYYEKNFAPQSGMGNTFNKGDSAKKYMLWAVKRYGQSEVDKMYRMKQTYKLWTEDELQEKYDHYKAEVDKLMVWPQSDVYKAKTAAWKMRYNISNQQTVTLLGSS